VPLQQLSIGVAVPGFVVLGICVAGAAYLSSLAWVGIVIVLATVA